MNTSIQGQKDRIWATIEAEKDRDRRIQRISRVAWTVTFLALLLVAVSVGWNTWLVLVGAMKGNVSYTQVFRTAMPFIWVLGTVSFLIAILSTVGMFMRLRTASLAEIQLRLAAVEEMISAQGNGGEMEAR